MLNRMYIHKFCLSMNRQYQSYVEMIFQCYIIFVITVNFKSKIFEKYSKTFRLYMYE